MTTVTTLESMLDAAATAAAATIASSEHLVAAPATRDGDAVHTCTHALIAPFAGAASGELLLAVDEELATALADAGVGPVGLAAALTPALEAVAAALGGVTLGPAQEADARLAVNRILAGGESALVPLLGAQRCRAAVALSVVPAPDQPAAAPVAAAVQAERLDLLRGVEMEATAELGRTRMTVNDLLALRAGAVIELDRVAGGPADLLVNGRLIARGEVVVVDENYGIRITQVVSDTGR